MRRNILNTRNTQGYTLIELLIALTLGAFLIGGILSLYVGSKRSYNNQQAATELQELGRFSLNALVADIRMGGFFGCGQSANLVNTLNTAANWAYDGSVPIVGYEGGSPGFPAAIAALAVPGTDAIKVTRAIPDDNYVVDTHATGTGTITLKQPHDIAQNELVVVTDCLNSSVFQVTNAGVGTSTINHSDAGGTVGNCTQGLGWPLNCGSTTGTPYQYGEDAFLMRYDTNAYYIGVGASGRNALFRLSLNADGTLGAPVEMADGVQDMQLVYGIDNDNDQSVDAYLLADAVGALNWGNVQSVQINLLMESDIERIADQPSSYVFFDGTAGSMAPVVPADNRLRRVFSSTVTIRNRNIT
ncbi:MAG: PilW family protein [Pseudomonadota bacterium]